MGDKISKGMLAFGLIAFAAGVLVLKFGHGSRAHSAGLWLAGPGFIVICFAMAARQIHRK